MTIPLDTLFECVLLWRCALGSWLGFHCFSFNSKFLSTFLPPQRHKEPYIPSKKEIYIIVEQEKLKTEAIEIIQKLTPISKNKATKILEIINSKGISLSSKIIRSFNKAKRFKIRLIEIAKQF